MINKISLLLSGAICRMEQKKKKTQKGREALLQGNVSIKCFFLKALLTLSRLVMAQLTFSLALPYRKWLASGQILCLFSFTEGSISFYHLLIKFPSATSVHVSLLVYRLKLPPTSVSSILLLFHIFTVPHLPSLRPTASFWSWQVPRKFTGFCFEFLNVRQPLLKDPRLLLPL